jgi:hypothetical protein
VVGAKVLLAGVLLALVCAASAAADDPTVRITKADQARAEAALLTLKDFGVGWTGGPKTPAKLHAPKCPGFDPKESDLTVTGHAEAQFVFPRQVQFDQDVQVLESADAVSTDFRRVIGPKLAACLAYQLKAGKEVVSARVTKLPFPKLGDARAAYRGTVVLRIGGRNVKVVKDYMFIGTGRLEYSLAVEAGAGAAREVMSFEQSVAQALVKKAGANVA